MQLSKAIAALIFPAGVNSGLADTQFAKAVLFQHCVHAQLAQHAVDTKVA